MGLLCITAECLRQYSSDSLYKRGIGVPHPIDGSIAVGIEIRRAQL
jgi:hypothetical protein